MLALDTSMRCFDVFLLPTAYWVNYCENFPSGRSNNSIIDKIHRTCRFFQVLLKVNSLSERLEIAESPSTSAGINTCLNQ